MSPRGGPRAGAGRPRTREPAPTPAARRGRPPGPTSAGPLAPPLWLRLSPQERAEVEGRALAAGVSMSAWVRGVVRLAIGLEPRP